MLSQHEPKPAAVDKLVRQLVNDPGLRASIFLAPGAAARLAPTDSLLGSPGREHARQTAQTSENPTSS